MDHLAQRAWWVEMAKMSLPLGLSLVLLSFLAVAGWHLWNNAVVNALADWNFDSPAALALFGLLAGAGSFFAPCSVSLFPGYITYYMSIVKSANPRPELKVGRSLLYGTSAAAGAVTFFALVGLALTLVGHVVSPILIHTKPLVAAAFVALGLVQLTNWTFQPARMVSMGGDGGPITALFTYGFGYGLASTGCTLPVYAATVLIPLTSGQAIAALITFLSFAAAMAVLMVTVSLLTGLAHSAIVTRFQVVAPLIKRLSGVVLILVGLYSGYYYLKAGM